MLTVTIETGNDAFADGRVFQECARILYEIAQNLENFSRSEGALMDFNGNKVGAYALTHE